jgi:hypothetical protein
MAKWHMVTGFSVPVCLCDSEIDDIGGVPQISETHQDVLRFDVTMNIIA